MLFALWLLRLLLRCRTVRGPRIVLAWSRRRTSDVQAAAAKRTITRDKTARSRFAQARGRRFDRRRRTFVAEQFACVFRQLLRCILRRCSFIVLQTDGRLCAVATWSRRHRFHVGQDPPASTVRRDLVRSESVSRRLRPLASTIIRHVRTIIMKYRARVPRLPAGGPDRAGRRTSRPPCCLHNTGAVLAAT